MIEQNNSGSSTSPDANPGIQPKAECTCTDKWLDPYCKYHTAQHDFLRESGAFDLTVGEALPNKDAPQSAETTAAIPSPGVDKGSYGGTVPMGVGQWAEHGKKFGYWDYFEKQAWQYPTAASWPQAEPRSAEGDVAKDLEPFNFEDDYRAE